MARCRSVPTWFALTPSTSAMSPLERSAWYLSAISSRSLAASVPSARRTASRSAASSAASSGPGSYVGAGSSAVVDALAAPQLVERRVAGDAEQPRARGPAAGVEAGAALVRALERLGGDVLGRGAVSQQRRGVGEDVVPRVPVERIEVERADRGGGKSRGAGRRHILTTIAHGIHHRSALDSFAPCSGSRCLLAVVACLLAPVGRGREGSGAVGDRQRLRHGQAAGHDRHPRLDARHAEGRAALDALPRAVQGRRGHVGGRRGCRLRLARARRRPRASRPSPAGRFSFAKPSKAVTLRGVVRFRWRKGDALPRTAEVATEGGHRSSAGSDPAGYSAGSCALGG